MEQARKENIQEKFEALLQSEDFCKELAECDNAEKTCMLLSKHQVDVTDDEINELSTEGMEAMAKMKGSDSAELSIDQLDDVSGGSKWLRGAVSIIGGAAGGFVGGLVCGVCPAATPVVAKAAVGYSIAAGVWISQG